MGSKRARLVAVAIIALLIGAIATIGQRSVAQEATPAPLEFEIAPGVTAGMVELGEDADPPLFRIQIAAGATWTEEGGDPSILTLYVESGELTINASMPLAVYRAGAADGGFEAIAAGTDVVVSAGDYFVGPSMAAATLANGGNEPATMIATSLVPTGAAAS